MIASFEGVTPAIGAGVFVADNASIVGNVRLSEQSSIWYGAVLRGDVGSITVGPRSNIQDLSVVHSASGSHGTRIGADVTVGHRAILHGCILDDLVLVGMGAIILDDAVIERECLIGAGALVTQGTRIPEGSLVLGSPARVVRTLTDAERERLHISAMNYVALAARHRIGSHVVGAGARGVNAHFDRAQLERAHLEL